MLLKYHFLGYFKEHNTLIGLLVVDICLTGVKASWPFLQTDDKDLTNEKVSKQFPTFSSLCECGISTWPTSQSSPHSTKLYGINHRRRGPTPYSHRITGVLVRNFERMKRSTLARWCVQTLWKTSNERLWQFLKARQLNLWKTTLKYWLICCCFWPKVSQGVSTQQLEKVTWAKRNSELLPLTRFIITFYKKCAESH